MVTTLSDIWDRAISPFLRLEPESNSERVRHTYTRAEASWRRVNEIPPHTLPRLFNDTDRVGLSALRD